MALSVSGPKSSRKLTANASLPAQDTPPTVSSQTPARAKSGRRASEPAPSTRPTVDPSLAVTEVTAIRKTRRKTSSVASPSTELSGDSPSGQPAASLLSPKARAVQSDLAQMDAPQPKSVETSVETSTSQAVEAVVKAVREVVSKASARSQLAAPARKTVHRAAESKSSKGAVPAEDTAVKAEVEAKTGKADKTASATAPKAAPSPSAVASESKTAKAKKTPPPPAPIISSPAPSSSARRNREREALNLYTTAMESFKQNDYDRARDVLQLLLSDFVLESEIADRARVFLKICEQKLQPTVL